MDRDHFYVTLFSNASQDIYPDNKIAAFTTQLAQPIRLNPSEIWEVGLCELSYSASHGLQKNGPLLNNLNVFLNALIYCDLIAPQLIGTTKLRCLRSYLFQNVYYVPLEKKTFRDIRIEILNQSGELIPFNDSAIPLKVVLHFRRVITPWYIYTT